MDIDDTLEIDIENKYINDKGKTKLTIEEAIYILKRKDFCDEVENIAIQTLLSELEKKDKIINEILDYFQSGLSMCEDCENWLDNEHCKKCLKEHFTNKVEESDK